MSPFRTAGRNRANRRFFTIAPDFWTAPLAGRPDNDCVTASREEKGVTAPFCFDPRMGTKLKHGSQSGYMWKTGKTLERERRRRA
jgi:hypothetical protein